MEFGKISFESTDDEAKKLEKRAQFAKILEENGNLIGYWEKKRKEQRDIRQKIEELNANPEEKLDFIQTNFNRLYDGNLKFTWRYWQDS